MWPHGETSAVLESCFPETDLNNVVVDNWELASLTKSSGSCQVSVSLVSFLSWPSSVAFTFKLFCCDYRGSFGIKIRRRHFKTTSGHNLNAVLNLGLY